MTSILEHTRVVIQKGTSVHVFDLSTKWQVILFYDLIKIFIINSIYKYCIWTFSISFLKIHLWLLCYNWWSSRIWIWFVGGFRIIPAILNRVANLTEHFGASGILVANQRLVNFRNAYPEQSLAQYQQRLLQIELLPQQFAERYNNTNSKLNTFPICAINQDSFVFKKFQDF